MSTNDETVQPEDANLEVETTETVEESEETTDVETEEAEKEDAQPEAEPPKPEPSKPEKRPVYTMPVAKAQEEKRKAVERAEKATEERLKAEYEARIADIQQAKGTDRVREIAEKHGLDADAVRDILSLAPKADMSKYDAILKENELSAARAQVNSDFDEKVRPELTKRYPNAPASFIEEVRQGMQDLAFTEEYSHYPVEHIYAVNASKFSYQDDLGAETPSGHGTVMSDFKLLSDAEQVKLAERDPATYARYVKWEEGQMSRFS